jgi:hypothetical protein
VAGEHQEVPEPLAQRMLGNERIELGHDVSRVTELDVGREALLERDEAQLFEAPDFCLRPVLERELREHRATPQLEGLLEQLPPPGRRGPPRVGEQVFEPVRIDLLAVDVEHVARLTRDQDVGAECLSQRHHAVVE